MQTEYTTVARKIVDIALTYFLAYKKATQPHPCVALFAFLEHNS